MFISIFFFFVCACVSSVSFVRHGDTYEKWLKLSITFDLWKNLYSRKTIYKSARHTCIALFSLFTRCESVRLSRLIGRNRNTRKREIFNVYTQMTCRCQFESLQKFDGKRRKKYAKSSCRNSWHRSSIGICRVRARIRWMCSLAICVECWWLCCWCVALFFFVWFSLMTSYGVRRDMEREDACLHIMCAVTYLMEVDDIIRVSASISIRYQTWSSFPKYPIFSARAFDSFSIYSFFCIFSGQSACARVCQSNKIIATFPESTQGVEILNTTTVTTAPNSNFNSRITFAIHVSGAHINKRINFQLP